MPLDIPPQPRFGLWSLRFSRVFGTRFAAFQPKGPLLSIGSVFSLVQCRKGFTKKVKAQPGCQLLSNIIVNSSIGEKVHHSSSNPQNHCSKSDTI